ncbi:TPR-like protein [Mycena amicta]|nr:TPR-like protein [Mycena amicta]
MFKPGDKMNPYDPASLDLGEDGPILRAAAGTGPKISPRLAKILQDPTPEQRNWLLSLYPRDNAETGETAMEQVIREKREWAEADAKSLQLKEEGNDAFRKGNYKKAFMIYTACMALSGHEPLYPLNRAAVGLKLKLYKTAVEDASRVLDLAHNFNLAKALFRRGQAFHFLGLWNKAEANYSDALKLQPNDSIVIQQVDELKRLRALSPEEQAAWITGQSALKLEEVFPPGTLKKEIEELLGRKLDEMEASWVD